MNKFTAVLFLACVCFTQSAPLDEEPVVPNVAVPIVSQENDASPDGEYKYSFESADGTYQEQKAVVKLVDNVPVLSVEGKYSYKDSEGVLQTITYTADENGYQPIGDSIPVGPEIPEAIVESLKYNEEHPYEEEEKK